jgi:hypothetical protein
MSGGFAIGDWCWHASQVSPCRVIDRQDLWGEVVYRVWLPAKDAVVRARAQDLGDLSAVRPTVEQILHAAAAPSCWTRWRTTCCWRRSSPAWCRCRISSTRSTAR